MAVRTRLLNGNNIARDTDFSKYIETVSEPGVIEGLTVTATKVAIGKCWVPCERANGETIYALVYNSSEASISGNGDVYIEIKQSLIDDGELADEDGTGIAEIKVGTMPSKNALLLATITNGVVTDQRNMIRKVGELNTLIKSLNTRMNTVEAEIDQIKEDKAVDHLEETGLVGELYTLSNTLFKQHTPTLANSTIDCNVGDVAANKQIHVQRITSKTASNSIKLKVKKVGAPTTGLVVEVRNATKVDVSNTEAYWYGGGSLICSGSIAYTAISTDYQEITVPLNGTFGGVQGQLVDVVVYQTGNIVNSTNYYVLACDSTQYSEAFSYVSVNGDTRTRSKLMPYCLSDGFAQYLLCKTVSYYTNKLLYSGSSSKYFAKSSSYELIQTNPIYTYTDDTGYSTQIRAVVTQMLSADGGREIWFGATPDGGTTVETAHYTDRNVAHTDTLNLTLGANQSLDLTQYFRDYWEGTVDTSLYLYGSGQIAKKQNIDITFAPLEVVHIGGQTGPVLFGLDSNGDFYVGDEVSSATTGSIAPGNFVGYVKIGKYKIPYYL